MAQDLNNISTNTQILSEADIIAQNEINMVYTLRYHRNRHLRETDWILSYDNAMSLSNLDEWITYRKALRDIDFNKKIEAIYCEHTRNIKWNEMLPKRPELLRKPSSS